MQDRSAHAESPFDTRETLAACTRCGVSAVAVPWYCSHCRPYSHKKLQKYSEDAASEFSEDQTINSCKTEARTRNPLSTLAKHLRRAPGAVGARLRCRGIVDIVDSTVTKSFRSTLKMRGVRSLKTKRSIHTRLKRARGISFRHSRSTCGVHQVRWDRGCGVVVLFTLSTVQSQKASEVL